MPVFQLEENRIYFPQPELAEEDGLLAVGGDLSVNRLLLAYENGIFPWYQGDEILWWCPKERFVIKPEEIHVSRSMKKYMRQHDIQIRFNEDFSDIMHRCRLKREFEEDGTWIDDDMEAAYKRLFDLGYALCVEAFVDGVSAGGLYGVCIGRCFFGESMFSDLENGSKIALIALAGILEKNSFFMIDCQFHTEHLESMGGKYISWKEYREMLDHMDDPAEDI